MYKLLLVDDEADVRDGLLHEIDWGHNGFEIVDTAENGREAMELIDRHAPDVVLTDISMPFMDGLALSDWIRSAHPATRIVLISGYEEFEYAQRAVGLDVDEYVLKPFEAGQIVQVLRKVKERIDGEVARREDMELLREHYRTSLPVMRETFLASLLSRKLPIWQIEEKAGSYGLQLAGRCYIVSAISLQQQADSGNAASTAAVDGEQRPSEGSLRSSGDIDLKLFAVLNIAEELWVKQAMGKAFIYQNHVILLAISERNDMEAVLQETLTVLQETVHHIERWLKLTVTIGVGVPVGGLTELKHSYNDALHALDYRIVQGQGGNRIIFIGDVERRFVTKLRFDELKEQALVRCMKVGTEDEMREAVNTLFDEIEQAHASYKDYQVFMLELLTAVLRAAKDADADLEDIFGGGNAIFADLQKLDSLQAARVWFASLCIKLVQHIASNRQHSYKQLVQQAIDYTKANYSDSEISVNKLCSHLHISAGYFSSVFKKEVKLTFVSYLMNIRMEAAQRLLRTTELKAFEIAEQVGFADPNYFSFCFKKGIGVSPKEYRNRSKED
ncbi:HTH-type transcriptional activator RhaR [Paenibacillus plantiphilus]|uniref:HTH-type transcriptional activator RhaR n=1 Tax=Paenibacillus plantiphilus TaxID=2905650 RepID=A0ABN8H5F9_9BACL|nr:response regulator [Paenibacillus plantiphilus]CAH1225514.1 HTH-type transcriptional activator RhaR [Paenibacillus plantiphilus]